MKDVFFKYCVVALLIISAGLTGCGQEQEEITVLQEAEAPQSDAVLHMLRVNGNLLKEPLTKPGEKPQVIMMVSQGDQVTVLEKYNEWSKVQHHQSGRIGWINNDFIQIESRSRWWSGDTEKARAEARKIYKDKSFLKHNYPITHVNIEERFNRMVFSVDEDSTFLRDEAEECVSSWIGYLQKKFPHWSSHQIFLNARDKNGQEYTVIIGDDGEPEFL